MKILALDTALNACSVAITGEGALLAHVHEKRARGHAETLLPMIRSLMQEAGLSFADLDLIAVSVGPGTFTGLRIGLAAARGIALAAGKPALGITTLEALAAAVPAASLDGKTVWATADARRKEVYAQPFRYEAGALLPTPCGPAVATPIKGAASLFADGPGVIIGGGAPLLASAGEIPPHMDILDTDPDPDARIIARIAEHRGIPQAPVAPPMPVYLRAPDAKLPGGKDPVKAS
ncbi:tRNA (adenosine(37)-N6)-threonylcarbamoyltransferase complex dimerization subunit type 1 TsaB [Sneathiella chinensis]|uniref:tRNA (Adenosine(37)-N6)-threonylcarbamoyltransferase complex dimerization subunit type 1 TsaB n=1 Tax=Sneathiella chinensis TaxID=349750 RepID=A0ABQ5TZA8_9PROT|nr:tRNA (adenosine(37)-N6)-threonylcarbamoyltransferase complex dimerization subunit type 1 TsaB [Sneathiella chinensis]GLQ05212.1 tRNA (adenosine(37)-N6)-threonylcarbamoyltransferase complex dimerization subunit type 1 TsaB [Sneathiella chinensis]